MKKYAYLFCSLLSISSFLSAEEESPLPAKAEGWSLDAGGQYTWMSLSSPSSIEGSTGGALGRLTYQKAKAPFGQIRTVYNVGSLSTSHFSLHVYEWYSEFVGGYSFSPLKNWTLTPYIGLGNDFFRIHHSAHSCYPSIQVRYRLYYAVVGLDTRYLWNDWYVGAQADCLPTFDQFFEHKSFPGIGWPLSTKVGFDVKLLAGRKICPHVWFELSPYYRYLPIGGSNTFAISAMNLDQWGLLGAFRFFL